MKKLRGFHFRPHLQGSSVAIDAAGKLIFVADALTNAVTVIPRSDMKAAKTVTVCKRPEQVVVSPDGGAFVSCRGDGKVVQLDDTGSVKRSREIGAEPFGIAMTPDGKTVLVTTASDAQIHALSADSLETEWSQQLPPHPRGVSVTPDGKQAIVAHLQGVSASVVDLGSHRKRFAKLPLQRDGWPNELLDEHDFNSSPVRKAGGAYVAAMSPGGTRAFVPYMLKNSGENIDSFIPGCYANGSQLPSAITVAAIDTASAKVLRPMPKAASTTERASSRMVFGLLNDMGRLGTIRAAVHDPKRARLLMVGEGSGMMMSFDTSKADPTSSPLETWHFEAPARGVAIDPAGTTAFVHMELTGKLAVVDLEDATAKPVEIALSSKKIDESVALGRKLFFTANDNRMAGITGVSCATCHLEGRTDGVSWMLDGHALQTPNLAGRNDYHGAIRWSGDSPSLEHAVKEAIKRLQGSGLPDKEVTALAAFIRGGAFEMDAPTNPHESATRGKEVFEAQGCNSCHLSDNAYTDNKRHTFRGTKYRTPSLRGLFLSAPYLHDGSVSKLGDLLAKKEKNNPMAVGHLSEDDRKALEAFLLSL